MAKHEFLKWLQYTECVGTLLFGCRQVIRWKQMSHLVCFLGTLCLLLILWFCCFFFFQLLVQLFSVLLFGCRQVIRWKQMSSLVHDVVFFFFFSWATWCWLFFKHSMFIVDAMVLGFLLFLFPVSCSVVFFFLAK